MKIITMSRAKCVSQSLHFKQSRVIALDERIFACERALWIIPQFIMWGKDTYCYPARISSRVKAKGKRHVSFPFCRLYPHETSLQAASRKPHLTLAMAAVVAFPAPFLVHHRVTATLWTEITGDAQMTQA